MKAVDPDKAEGLTKDFDTWYRYAYYQVLLARDFKALDTAGQLLTKGAFLHQFASGRVLALVNGTDHKQPVYQLCAYPGGPDPAIRATASS